MPTLVRRMVARDPHEAHRAATPLELLYDLCFVVAIAQAAAELHHSLAAGHAGHGVGAFGMVFFAIWWAWMGFAWFASSFDTDDVPYRLKVLLQMVGVLVLAAGVPRAFEQGDWRLITAGFTIMRIGLVAQWLRAARAAPDHRRTALRYALGITLCQVGWLALALVPPGLWVWGWCAMAPAEMAVPLWAERARATHWHPHHIAERYGLLVIIVLGESVLAGTLAIQAALDVGATAVELAWVILAAPLIVFSLWWLYFSRPHHAVLANSRRAFVWGYAHFFLFAAAAAVGAGLAVAVDGARGAAAIPVFWAGQCLAVPIVVYLAALWFVMVRPLVGGGRCHLPFALAAVLVLLAPLVEALAPVAMGLVLVGLTAATVWLDRADNAHDGH